MSNDKDKQNKDDHGHLTVTIHDEDTGRDIVLNAGQGEKVQHLIDELYKKLGREPSQSDRIRCGGEDVARYADEKLKEFLKHCSTTWTFTGPTGGA